MSHVGVDSENRVGYAAKHLQQALRSAADHGLRPIGLTMPQYAVLSALAAGPGLSNSELARRCFVTRQTMNDVLVGLQRAGLISRQAHPRDRRVQRTELTRVGREILERGDAAVVEVEDQMTAGLSQAERRQLLSLLSTCIDNLEGAATRPNR